jgi:hypothetical protein
MKRFHKSLLGAGLLLVAAIGSAFGQNINITGSLTAGGQISGGGSTTNDTACTGCIGEFISSRTDLAANASAGVTLGSVVTSAPLLTTTVVANVTQVLLTAGDWDCRGDVALQVATGGGAAVTTFAAWTSNQNQTFAPPLNGTVQASVNNRSYVALQAASVTSPGWAIGPQVTRYSLAATTSIFLNTVATFSAGTVGAVGDLDCRRAR